MVCVAPSTDCWTSVSPSLPQDALLLYFHFTALSAEGDRTNCHVQLFLLGVNQEEIMYFFFNYYFYYYYFLSASFTQEQLLQDFHGDYMPWSCSDKTGECYDSQGYQDTSSHIIGLMAA